jgi:predicted aspartyl protease
MSRSAAVFPALPEYLPIATTRPVSKHAGEVLAEFEYNESDGLILIPVLRDGKHAFFILDTDSSGNVLDKAAFPNLVPFGSAQTMSTANGSTRMQIYNPPPLHIGPISLADSGPVICLDLSTLSEIFNAPVIGLLGAPALKDFILQLDCDEHKVRFLPPQNQPWQEWGKVLPMRVDGHNIAVVRMNINGVSDDFQIDTGDKGDLSLPTRSFDDLQKKTGRSFISLLSFTANGVADLKQMRIALLECGGVPYHDLICSELKGDTGTIGIDFLSRHLVELDYPNSRFYFKPGKEFDRHSEINMAGVQIQTKHSRRVIIKVITGGPADLAGLKTGDILDEVNGRQAMDYRGFELEALLQAGDGNEVVITYSRGQIQKTARFELKRIL